MPRSRQRLPVSNAGAARTRRSCARSSAPPIRWREEEPMNANTDFALSRRTMLAGTGALVIAVSMGGTGEVLAQAATAIAKKHPTDLDSWLSIGRDGKVTLFFGKIDGGQGTDLAIGQIVAEELDVPMSSIEVVQGDSALTINQGGAS